MPAVIGQGAAHAFRPSLETPQSKRIAEQAEAINAKQTEAVAETVQRQANFSSNRAENLNRQAEKLEELAQSRQPENGLGTRVDIYA